MEALRFRLAVPSSATVLMTWGCFHAMKVMIKPRYETKDDDGKSLLPHPYAPWTAVPEKNKKQADEAYRAYKMYENVKEWTFLSLPLMWTTAVFAGCLPFMNQGRVDALIAGTSLIWMYGNSKYVTGYVKSPDDRIFGFRIRTRTTIVWLAVSSVCAPEPVAPDESIVVRFGLRGVVWWHYR